MTTYRVEPTDKALVDAGEAYSGLTRGRKGQRFAGMKGS